NIIARGESADLTLSGSLDLATRALDAHLTLSGPPDGGAPGTSRPDVFIALQGPAATPERTLDVSALVNWLMLRSLDRETRRMEAVQSEKQDPAAAPAETPSLTGRTEPPPAFRIAPPEGALPPLLPENPSAPNATAAPVEQLPNLPPPVQSR